MGPLSALMDLSAKGTCFAPHRINTWYQLLAREKQVARNDKALKSEEPATLTTAVIKLEAKALHYVRVPGIWSFDI